LQTRKKGIGIRTKARVTAVNAQENRTCAHYTQNEEEKTASVYTYNGKFKRKLAELADSRPEEVKLECIGIFIF